MLLVGQTAAVFLCSLTAAQYNIGMNAIILSIGSELITGQVTDTNSGYLSRRLEGLGIGTIAHWTIGDDQPAIARTIRQATDEANVVLVTGGLGPTADDLTRHGLADAMGCELRLDQQCLKAIEQRFASRGLEMPATNRRQGLIPAGAQAMPNRRGTAPGIRATIGEAKLFVMPGVPSEMVAMFDEFVAPNLPASDSVTIHRTVHAFGGGESDIAERLGDLMSRQANPTVGTTVSCGLITIRIAARSTRVGDAERLADACAAEVIGRLGELVIGAGEETISSVVGRLLLARNATLATAESCTGGLVGELLTDTPGASEYYLGGVVAYSNTAKSRLLAVGPELIDADGAVSPTVVAAMAAGCRERFSADWAVAVTGIAGPGGGTPDKPLGLVYIAVAGPPGPAEAEQVHRHTFGGTRQAVRLRSAMWTLNHLRLALMRSPLAT